MSEAWVVNASPVILFARIGRLDVIERLAPTLLVPNAVLAEVHAGREKDSTAASALEWADKYRVGDVAVPASIEHWDLGPGESQVIAHGIIGSRWVVLDDRAARRCAMAHNVNRKVIDEVRPLVRKLIERIARRNAPSEPLFWRNLRSPGVLARQSRTQSFTLK